MHLQNCTVQKKLQNCKVAKLSLKKFLYSTSPVKPAQETNRKRGKKGKHHLRATQKLSLGSGGHNGRDFSEKLAQTS